MAPIRRSNSSGGCMSSSLRRERAHAGNEVPQKFVGFHEHREVSRTGYRDEIFAWCAQRGHELLRETCRRRKILRSLYHKDGDGELSGERLRIQLRRLRYQLAAAQTLPGDPVV